MWHKAVTQEKEATLFPLSLPFSQRPTETQLSLNESGLLLTARREDEPWGAVGHSCKSVLGKAYRTWACISRLGEGRFTEVEHCSELDASWKQGEF